MDCSTPGFPVLTISRSLLQLKLLGDAFQASVSTPETEGNDIMRGKRPLLRPNLTAGKAAFPFPSFFSLALLIPQLFHQTQSRLCQNATATGLTP